MPDPFDESDLISSPVKAEVDDDEDFSADKKAAPRTPSNKQGGGSRFGAAEAREAALRRELEGVRNINEVIEGVIGTLERARGNMGTVSRTVDNASALLNTWTRILSQTEHNQRLILNPEWKGATDDIEALETEALQRQQAAERRAAEEERRREEVRRRAEEAERQREAGASSSSARPGVRGARGSRVSRGALARGGTTSSSTASFRVYGSSRAGSGIGRGFGAARGTRGTARGRGV